MRVQSGGARTTYGYGSVAISYSTQLRSHLLTPQQLVTRITFQDHEMWPATQRNGSQNAQCCVHLRCRGYRGHLPAHRVVAGNCRKARHLRIFGVASHPMWFLHRTIRLADLEILCVAGYSVSAIGKKQGDSLLGRRQRTMLTDQR